MELWCCIALGARDARLRYAQGLKGNVVCVEMWSFLIELVGNCYAASTYPVAAYIVWAQCSLICPGLVRSAEFLLFWPVLRVSICGVGCWFGHGRWGMSM